MEGLLSITLEVIALQGKNMGEETTQCCIEKVAFQQGLEGRWGFECGEEVWSGASGWGGGGEKGTCRHPSKKDPEFTEKQQAVQVECMKGEREIRLKTEIRTRSFHFRDTTSLSFLNIALSRVACLLKPKRTPCILQPLLWLELERLSIYAPWWYVRVFFLQYLSSISAPYTGGGWGGTLKITSTPESKDFRIVMSRCQRPSSSTHWLTVEKTGWQVNWI